MTIQAMGSMHILHFYIFPSGFFFKTQPHPVPKRLLIPWKACVSWNSYQEPEEDGRVELDMGHVKGNTVRGASEEYLRKVFKTSLSQRVAAKE